jgi:hypothetical protein
MFQSDQQRRMAAANNLIARNAIDHEEYNRLVHLAYGPCASCGCPEAPGELDGSYYCLACFAVLFRASPSRHK